MCVYVSGMGTIGVFRNHSLHPRLFLLAETVCVCWGCHHVLIDVPFAPSVCELVGLGKDKETKEFGL